MIYTIFWLSCSFIFVVSATKGFLLPKISAPLRPTAQRPAGIARPYVVSSLKSTEWNGFNDDEVKTLTFKEMQDMIIALSNEEADDTRREKLESIFEAELAKPNGAPKQFSDLFDYTLVIVGDRVKLEAQKAASEIQDQAASNREQNHETEKEQSPNQPFPQQRQLWALVDMMVQSKTIVKRASGDLGSKGLFQ